MPPNKHKFEEKEGKGKKHLAGTKGKPGSLQVPGVTKPAVLKPAILPPEAPAGFVPATVKRAGSKKWCLKNTQVLHAAVKKFIGSGRNQMHLSSVEQDSFPVTRHKVVDVLKQKISSTWSAVTFESVAFELIDPVKRTRAWVTTRVTGWLPNSYLDDYSSPYPDAEVDIPHATPLSTDAQQYMTLEIDEEEKKFKHVIRQNMCGELSVAYVAKKDIDTVLTDWKAKKGGFFKDRLGMGKDTTLGPGHMQDILDIYFPEAGGGKRIERYMKVEDTVPPKITKIPLAAPGRPVRASDEFQSKSKTHDFITLVRIDTTTGELIAAANINERNHWVVVTRILQGGYRVELYNPFPNKRQAYTFSEFYAASVGGSIVSGWWVKRNKTNPVKPYHPPVIGVAANHPTSNTEDAEQYVFIEGGGIKPKTRLCGEFCTAFIIGSSMSSTLENWNVRQNSQPAGLWELSHMLDAYGFNNKEGRRSFSIDTLLRCWKKIQPNLHKAAVGGDTNEGTDLLDLMSILRAYGYRREDMSLNRPGANPEPLLFSPARDAKPLKKYFLIAGVMINGSTGRLKDKTGGGVEHWVVVNSIDPDGNQFGGGGGWVELYNPFPNCWEEYSLGEFTKAFNGGTLWVKREITPVFAPEMPAPPKIKIKPGSEVKAGKGGKGQGKGKGAPQAFSVQDIVREFNNLINQPNAVPGKIIQKLVNRTGLNPAEISKLVGVNKTADKPGADLERKLIEHLGVKSIPGVVTTWIREKTRGEEAFAIQLAESLRRAGILVVKADRTSSLADLDAVDVKSAVDSVLAKPNVAAAPDRQELLRQAGEQITFEAARSAGRPFISTALVELKAIAAKMAEERAHNSLIGSTKPIHALKPREEYLEWIKSVEASSDRLYRVRRWGDPVMVELGFDITTEKANENAPKSTAHFQAVGLYNKITMFGAIDKFLRIPRDDIDNLIQMQIEEERDGELVTRKQKMDWLCSFRGKIYLYDDREDEWETVQSIKWGTLALGGNLVQVDKIEEMKVKLPGDDKVRKRSMARLVGFKKKDWAKPLDELLAEGLVHRGFCVYKKNKFGDTPKGMVFTPVFNPGEWDFAGTAKPEAFYIPFDYLEEKKK